MIEIFAQEAIEILKGTRNRCGTLLLPSSVIFSGRIFTETKENIKSSTKLQNRISSN